MELSRRGYVVFAPDITSAGMSSPVQSTSTVGFGIYDLVDYVYYNLDYVDNSKIGMAGFSKGGNNVYDTMMQYGVEQRETPDEYVKCVAAAMIIDPRFLPKAVDCALARAEEKNCKKSRKRFPTPTQIYSTKPTETESVPVGFVHSYGYSYRRYPSRKHVVSASVLRPQACGIFKRQAFLSYCGSDSVVNW